MKKLLIFIIFYFLALFQSSFLIHFKIFGIVPNFLLITVLLLIFLEKPRKNNGIFGAAVSGFFWDIFSSGPLGLHVLILVVSAVLIKLILRKYINPNFYIKWKNILETKE